MKIEHKSSIHAPPEHIWVFLTDPYRVVSCLPGVTITEKLDNRTYRGTSSAFTSIWPWYNPGGLRPPLSMVQC